MGCTASNDALLLKEINDLKEYLRQQETKSHEQQNLLRFKVEVLVNMLAVEEKRNDVTSKRLDTMKWLLHSQGVNENTITKILNELEKDGKLNLENSITLSTQLMDLSGAIQKMREEFELHRADIIHCCALSNGKLMPALPLKDFIEQTFQVTEKISKIDLKLLAMRFDDGHGSVCIPEFLEYFSISPELRNAIIAERAVKMSLDLYSLDVELLEENEDGEEDDTNGDGMKKKAKKPAHPLSQSIIKDEYLLYDEIAAPELRKSHFTKSLDRGAKRLLLMWPIVRTDLETNFVLYQKAQSDIYDENSTDEIIETAIFKKTLEEVCNKFSLTLEKAQKEGLIIIGGLKEKPKSLTNSEEKVGEEKEDDKNNKTGNTNNNKKNSTGKENQKPEVDNNKNPKDPKKDNNNTKPPLQTSKSKDLSKSKNDNDEKEQPEKPPLPTIDPLDNEDIQFLIDRFEISGYIHYGHFIEFFQELYQRYQNYSKKFISIPDDLVSSNPFRLSTEWNALKQSSILRQSYQEMHEKSEQSILKNKDRLSKSKGSFTAPKKLPSDPAPKKPVEKKEEEEKDSVEEEKVKEEPKKTKEPEKKKEEPPAKPKEEEKKPEDKPTAPVVKQSSCFLCGGGAAKKPNQPIDIADEKKIPPKKDEKKSKKGDDDDDEENRKKDLKIETDSLADSKNDDSLVLKRDDSFDTPKNIKKRGVPKFDALENTNNNLLPDRDGLGHGDMGEKRKVVVGGGGGSRFRRRADRDFDQEKPELDED